LGKVKIDLIEFHKSIGHELNTVKNRVRSLIGDAHWQKEGEYKEAVLKNCIKRFLPFQYSLGSGFVLIKDAEEEQVTGQIDIIVYDNSYPVLFKDGDFVILLPESIRGIIEVKSKSNLNQISNAVKKMNNNARLIYKIQKESKEIRRGISENKIGHLLFVGLFNYDLDVDDKKFNAENSLQWMRKLFSGEVKKDDDLTFDDRCKYFVNNISISDNLFGGIFHYKYHGLEWDSYHHGIWNIFNGLSKSFFITQLLWYLEPIHALEGSKIWTQHYKQKQIAKKELGRKDK
jgi:hypothetical protein